jgi:hypothetical protein
VEGETKMRECPQCGFKEPPIWRNRMAKRLYVQYCRIDEFELWYPKLAKELKNAPLGKNESRYLFNNGVKYKLTKKGYVERIDAFLCAHPEPENPSISEPHFEKHKAKLIGYNPKFQTRLLDVPKKEKNKP